MTCSEFQKVLPYIIESGGNAEEEAHLKSCAVCADLVQDLKYIAEQAKLLVPMEDPSPRVWTGIRSALEREGLVRPVRGTARFRSPAAVIPARAGALGSLLALAALLLVSIGLLTDPQGRVDRQATATAAPAQVVAANPADQDDERLLAAVREHSPALAAVYQDGLSSVTAYISDAQRRVAENPDDVQARDHLVRAYSEKAVLYDMALSRTLE